MKWNRHDPDAPTDRADFIARWVERLFDPLTKQTRNKLKSRKTGGMCCLGVACEVAKIEPVKETDYTFTFDGMESELPHYVATFLKMDSEGRLCSRRDNVNRNYLSEKDRLFNTSEDHTSLAELNDRGATFRTIAKIIQQKAHLLFQDLTQAEHEYIMGVQPPAWETVLEKRRSAKASRQNPGKEASA